ncbi:MAG: SDR family oxidoreductase [Caldilineaceae bacterium]|nr:SDR family oxidoreductase [Caldilineaceae bacterium]
MGATELQFAGKAALITGGGTGIGAAIAEEFATQGARVAICGRREAVLNATVARLQAAGLQVTGLVGDVASDGERIVRSAVDELGRLDVLVNNAAQTAGVGVAEMPSQSWRRVLAVNLDAAFELVHHALPHLIAVRGVVLHISSISAIAGEFDDVAYAASKAGLEGFSRRLALEVAEHGIRSNVIRPGLIRTEAFDAMPSDFFDAQIPLIPLRQIGQPKDIARAAAFLCSADAQFITGAVLTIDGGESAK